MSVVCMPDTGVRVVLMLCSLNVVCAFTVAPRAGSPAGLCQCSASCTNGFTKSAMLIHRRLSEAGHVFSDVPQYLFTLHPRELFFVCVRSPALASGAPASRSATPTRPRSQTPQCVCGLGLAVIWSRPLWCLGWTCHLCLVRGLLPTFFQLVF